MTEIIDRLTVKIDADAAAAQAVLQAVGDQTEATAEQFSDASQAIAISVDRQAEALRAFGDQAEQMINDFAGGLASALDDGKISFAEFSQIALAGLQSLVSTITQLVGNNLTGPAASAFGIFQSFLGGFGGFRADGGPVAPTRPYMVGERGPELFVPNASGTILPQMPPAVGRAGVTININGLPPERQDGGVRRSSRQIVAALARQGSQAAAAAPYSPV